MRKVKENLHCYNSKDGVDGTVVHSIRTEPEWILNFFLLIFGNCIISTVARSLILAAVRHWWKNLELVQLKYSEI